MAVQTIRTDDINGDPDATLTTIVVNGHGVEVDLGPKSAERLAKVLEPFYTAGTPATYDVTRRNAMRKARANTNGNGAAGHDVDLADLRQWAAANNIAVPQRGRVPGATVEAYKNRAT